MSGVGMTTPDPAQFYTSQDGVVYPMGKGVPAPVGHSSLLYNEYPCTTRQNSLNIGLFVVKNCEFENTCCIVIGFKIMKFLIFLIQWSPSGETSGPSLKRPPLNKDTKTFYYTLTSPSLKTTPLLRPLFAEHQQRSL